MSLEGLIARAERYFRTDILYLARGSFWLGLSQTVNAAVAFFLLLAFANLLPPETYGVYRYILSIAAILAIPTLERMRVAITQAVANGLEGTLTKGFETQVRWGLWGAIGSTAVGLYYFSQGNMQLAIGFLIPALFIPFMDPLKSATSLLAGRKLFKETAWVVTFERVVELFVTVSVLVVTNNVLLVIASYFATNTLTRLLAFWYIIKRCRPNTRANPEAISYGKHLSAMGIVGIIAGELDKILLWHYLGPVSLALYSFAQGPVLRIQSVIASVEQLAFPKFAAQDAQSIKESLPRKLLHLRIAMLGVVIAYIVAAPTLYGWLLPQYLDSVIYSQFFAIILLFLPQKFIGSALTAHSQTKALYVLSIVGPLVKIAFLLLLIPLFGIAGAIAASLVLYSVNGIILYYYFRRL